MNDLTLLERLATKGRLPGVAPSPTSSDFDQHQPQYPAPANPAGVHTVSIDSAQALIDLALLDIETQIRTRFDDNYIVDLALDFVHSGLLQPKQPITVFRRDNGRYLLDAGENRVRAMRYAATQREAWGVNDPQAFTAIRATVLGPEPNKLSRLQSQARENLLRDELNDVDLARAVKQFLEATPGATHTDAAGWVGFVNLKSGRVRVHNALKLLQCDADLVDAVRAGELAASRALVLHSERQRPVATDVPRELGTTIRKPRHLSLPFESVHCVSEILLAVAKTTGIELIESDAELTRDTVKTLFTAPALATLLDRVKP